jgi:CRP-like cAMP-binding protein
MQAWVELSVLEGPDYFGEAAVLGRGVRHATAIANSNVELLVLTKVDMDLKIDSESRELVGVLVSKYPKDDQLLRYC